MPSRVGGWQCERDESHRNRDERRAERLHRDSVLVPVRFVLGVSRPMRRRGSPMCRRTTSGIHPAFAAWRRGGSMHRLPLAGALPAVALTLIVACEGDAPQAPRASASPVETDAGADVTLAPFNLKSKHAPAGALNSACGAAVYRKFDFWVGQWEIEDFAGGEPPVDGGDDIITSELGGCAVFENYAGGGFVGRSMNTVDPLTGQWHQHWSDNTGLVLDLVGAPTATGMLLEGDRPAPGGTVHDRIEWTPLSSTEVRQLWQFSSNGGPVNVQFDGHYHKRASVVFDPEVPTTACQDA